MTPRFKTILIWSVIGLNLLIAIAAVTMRDNLFRFLITPAVPFQVDEHPPAPDYNDAAAWAIRPQSGALDVQKADVFFIHPTTAWSGADGWNADIADPISRTRLEDVALPNHSEPFAAAGAIWAPRYRQAVLYASLARREDSREALDFAYQDVKRAFEAFEKSRDPNRQMIVVGIGQGGLHALRLLQETPNLARQLAAAYLIDQPVPTFLYEGQKAIEGFPKPCETRQSVNCFVSYSALDGGDSRGEDLISSRAIIWTPAQGYHSLANQAFACVNPLTGGTNQPDAMASANRGSAAATGLERGTQPPLLPGETGARCRKGLLLVEVNRPAALSRQRSDLGTFYKLTGYNLFYEALSRDAQGRVAATGPRLSKSP
jgi:pimeloyl-ACP methyl ester carboxylesterase